ncbi:hypothetical protein [Ralstonia pseudosolanacearum]|uniref:hypothetical protein n=1 Tax=Ralstonia pseudosolanacearum TaxID=1310165 RepID=UPI0013C32C00|nr:hypothetical protein [Ralstonia pseudosolanacearum]NKA59965.1 hypothetical protein [Ralstonia solanacearum]NKF72991.1 hypothetical protein [Ralstonia solanacearum]
MTRDELTVLVPVHESPTGGRYVRLRDIPNPWRSEFDYDSLGATLPAIAGEAECHWVGDWVKWPSFRFEPDYTPRYDDLVYREISDAELDEAAHNGQHSVIALKSLIRKPAKPVSAKDKDELKKADRILKAMGK